MGGASLGAPLAFVPGLVNLGALPECLVHMGAAFARLQHPGRNRMAEAAVQTDCPSAVY